MHQLLVSLLIASAHGLTLLKANNGRFDSIHKVYMGLPQQEAADGTKQVHDGSRKLRDGLESMLHNLDDARDTVAASLLQMDNATSKQTAEVAAKAGKVMQQMDAVAAKTREHNEEVQSGAATAADGTFALNDADAQIRGRHRIHSGDTIMLEAESNPGHFVSTRSRGNCGNPSVHSDPHRHTCGEFGLKSQGERFTMQKKSGEGPIKSSDMVELITSAGKQVHLQFEGYVWPYPLITKKRSKSGQAFKVTKAKEIDINNREYRAPGPGGFGYWPELLKDPTEGQELRVGDSVFIATPDEHDVKINAVSGTPVEWMFMQSSPVDGHREDDDGHVGFPHHILGYSGKKQNIAAKDWTNLDDPKSTANRFRIVKV